MAQQDQKNANNSETIGRSGALGNQETKSKPEETGNLQSIRNVRDVAEKFLEAENDVFADIMNVLLFGGRQEVAEDELEQAMPRSIYKAGGRLREQERDVAKYWRTVNVRIAFLGIENQSVPDVDMPLRVISYDGAAYRSQLGYAVSTDDVPPDDSTPDEDRQDGEQDVGGKLTGGKGQNRRYRYPVVTVVLYFGTEKHWDQPITLHKALGSIPESLKPYVIIM